MECSRRGLYTHISALRSLALLYRVHGRDAMWEGFLVDDGDRDKACVEVEEGKFVDEKG